MRLTVAGLWQRVKVDLPIESVLQRLTSYGGLEVGPAIPALWLCANYFWIRLARWPWWWPTGFVASRSRCCATLATSLSTSSPSSAGPSSGRSCVSTGARPPPALRGRLMLSTSSRAPPTALQHGQVTPVLSMGFEPGDLYGALIHATPAGTPHAVKLVHPRCSRGPTSSSLALVPDFHLRLRPR